MRISCEFKTDEIPVGKNMLFVSLIKEALKNSNQEYFEKLYNYEGKSNKKIKNFCFAVMMKNYYVENEIIKIKDRVILNLTTPDYEFGINVYNGLNKISKFEYKDFLLNKIRITLVKEIFINEEKVVFKTLSPILIKGKENSFLEPSDISYETEMNYIVNKNLEKYRGYGLKKPLIFKEIQMKKVVVKEEIREFTKSTGKKYFYVNAFSGVFSLEGDIEDLNLIYQNGIGFRRSQGFGMINRF